MKYLRKTDDTFWWIIALAVLGASLIALGLEWTR